MSTWTLREHSLASLAVHPHGLTGSSQYTLDPKASAGQATVPLIPLDSIKIAPKPYMIGSLGPKALKYESFEGKGLSICSAAVVCLVAGAPSLLLGRWA